MTTKYAQTGFTLLELLVAMSLMVVASACLYSSLYTGFKAKRSSERTLYPLQTAQTVIDILGQDLRGAVVGPADDPNTLAGPFLGSNDHIGTGPDADQITFYSTHHQINGDAGRMTCGIGLIELTIEKDPGADIYYLVRKVTDNVISSDLQEPVEEILCRRLYALNFRYYDGLRWYDDWDSTEQMDALPLAVEVTLELEPWQWISREQEARSSRSPLNMDYRNSITRFVQVFTLPRAVSMDEVEAAAAAAEAAQTSTTQ